MKYTIEQIKKAFLAVSIDNDIDSYAYLKDLLWQLEDENK